MARRASGDDDGAARARRVPHVAMISAASAVPRRRRQVDNKIDRTTQRGLKEKFELVAGLLRSMKLGAESVFPIALANYKVGSCRNASAPRRCGASHRLAPRTRERLWMRRHGRRRTVSHHSPPHTIAHGSTRWRV